MDNEIRVKDVRIGNLFEWKSYANRGVSKVVFIENRATEKTPYESPLFQVDSGARGHECQPIALNDYWLLKLGFNKSMPGHYICGPQDFTIAVNNDGKFIFDSWGAFPIKYVHQLQNLYHALTGEELQ